MLTVPHDPNIYIGDFPDPIGVRKWIEPTLPPFKIDAQTYPFVSSGFITTSQTSFVLPMWRVDAKDDKITLKLDLPGVHVEDLSLEIENGTLKLLGSRKDTGATVSQMYLLGPDYDPKTADATLECGVLTLVVLKYKEKLTHKIEIVQK